MTDAQRRSRFPLGRESCSRALQKVGRLTVKIKRLEAERLEAMADAKTKGALLREIARPAAMTPEGVRQALKRRDR